jgi:hypothetical protein
MNILRQKLIDEMEVRGLSRNTKDSYIGYVYRLARYYHRSPDQISDTELRIYLLHLLREKKNGASTLCLAVSALRFFYRHVLQRSTEAIETALPRMKKPVLRPRVYSPEQVARLLQIDGLNLKHRTVLMTTYAAGLRVSEVVRLRPEHKHQLPPQQWRVLRAILACRTPELGGHLFQCSNCSTQRFVPHSCRNRHCPTCQGANGYALMQTQADSLLPIPYFHVVFTLPPRVSDQKPLISIWIAILTVSSVVSIFVNSSGRGIFSRAEIDTICRT